MKVIKNPVVVCFDVDATILGYDIENVDPKDVFEIGIGKHKCKCYEMKKHTQRIKNHKASNHFIVLWSGSGVEWCQAVSKQLGLDSYVDLMLAKPKWAYDDAPFVEWCKRIYLYEKK